jgi:membrane associated rhomboid family serine protease
MDRLLARLDRRFGRYAIEGLPLFIAGGMAIVLLLAFVRPELLMLLMLSPHAIAQGQVWRLVTYLFIPEGGVSLWTAFNIYWIWMLGSSLESEWGAFKLNVYYFVGMLGTTAAALIVGPQGNFYLNLSLLFALATLFPNVEIMWFGIISIAMKWFGWLGLAYLLYEAATGTWAIRAAIIAASSNYLLFFGGDIVRLIRGSGGQGRRGASGGALRRASSSSIAPPPKASAQARACAICGATEADGADIRVCPCEKCRAVTGGQTRMLCLEHARNH